MSGGRVAEATSAMHRDHCVALTQKKRLCGGLTFGVFVL